jgi:hypothetical protein
MHGRTIVLTATTLACLALGACGSDAERPAVTLPSGSSLTLPARPTTVPPETTQPETTQPETTQPDTTQPETTQPETTTPEAPADEVPPAEAPPEADPLDEDASGTPWWPWLLGGLAVAGLIVVAVRRRADRATAWREQTAAAFAEAIRLATFLTAVAPDGAAMIAAQEAPQLAGLSARLSALGTEASDESRQQAIESVRTQVQVLHGVVDGIALGSGPVSPAALEYLKEQARLLHSATARARAEVFPEPTAPGGTGSD